VGRQHCADVGDNAEPCLFDYCYDCSHGITPFCRINRARRFYYSSSRLISKAGIKFSIKYFTSGRL
jgi:hypothetical protein